MELNLEKNSITLYGKSYKYDLLVNKLTSLPGEDLYQFITNRGIALPRKMNCMALTSVLNERIKYLHSKSMAKDYFARLENYKFYGETALVAMFRDLCGPDDYYKYRYNLINLILMNHEGLSLNDGEIQYLRNIKKSGVETFLDYENFISASCLEQEGTFDGVKIDDLKKSLLYSATQAEIVDLGKKYGIDIPQHLTRDEYYDFIVYYLDKKNKYTEDVEADLSTMTLAGLTTFSRRNGIPLNPTLAKEDHITYLFYYLDGCEITTTSLNDIVSTDIYEPLDFKVDLSQINVFGEGEAKRIISFDGDDDPEYVEKINEIIDKANNPQKDEPVEQEAIAAPLRPGEKTMDDDEEGDIELEDFEIALDEEKKKTEEETKKQEEEIALNDEEIMKLIEKDNEDKSVEPEVVVEKIDISNVVKNDEYASKKLKNLKYGNRNIIILSVVISFILIVLGFVIYALVR